MEAMLGSDQPKESISDLRHGCHLALQFIFQSGDRGERKDLIAQGNLSHLHILDQCFSENYLPLDIFQSMIIYYKSVQ